MASYIVLTTSRVTVPDRVELALLVNTVTADNTASIFPVGEGSWRGKKTSPWTVADILAVQNVLDTTPALTPQLAAQRTIDSFPIEFKALVFALIDQLNVIRAALPTPLPLITPAQALAAVRVKAGTL